MSLPVSPVQLPDCQLNWQATDVRVSTLEVAAFTSGDLKPTARSSAPSGWLLCDGSAVSRTTYATLFAAIGTTYGTGDGSTTFNVPDMRGRAPVGMGTGPSLTARALGATGGEETHILSVAEMPSHTHNLRKGSTAAVDDTTAGIGAGGTTRIETSGNATAAGGGGAHNNMQPFVVVNWLVKT